MSPSLKQRFDVLVVKSSTGREEVFGSYRTESEALTIANYLSSLGADVRMVPIGEPRDE